VNHYKQPPKVNTALVAIIVALIISVPLFLFWSTYNSHKNEQLKKEQLAEEIKQEEQKAAQSQQLVRDTELNACLQRAENDYWKFAELNATSVKQGDDGPIYTMTESNWATADSKKKADEEACYRKATLP